MSEERDPGVIRPGTIFKEKGLRGVVEINIVLPRAIGKL